MTVNSGKKKESLVFPIGDRAGRSAEIFAGFTASEQDPRRSKWRRRRRRPTAMKTPAAAPAPPKRGGWRALPVLVLVLLSMLVPLVFVLNHSGESGRGSVRFGFSRPAGARSGAVSDADLVVAGVVRWVFLAMRGVLLSCWCSSTSFCWICSAFVWIVEMFMHQIEQFATFVDLSATVCRLLGG